jgi:DNA-binding transcriptional regulator YhcF (GntR family)
MDIIINAGAPEPVYEQIVRQIHEGVTSGELTPGTSLPPVRQLATDLVLNRNTVARAYKILEDQGVIQTAGRKGTFVRSGAADEVTRLKTGQAERVMRHMIEALVSDGLSRDEISSIFNSALALEGKG